MYNYIIAVLVLVLILGFILFRGGGGGESTENELEDDTKELGDDVLLVDGNVSELVGGITDRLFIDPSLDIHLPLNVVGKVAVGMVESVASSLEQTADQLFYLFVPEAAPHPETFTVPPCEVNPNPPGDVHYVRCADKDGRVIMDLDNDDKPTMSPHSCASPADENGKFKSWVLQSTKKGLKLGFWSNVPGMTPPKNKIHYQGWRILGTDTIPANGRDSRCHSCVRIPYKHSYRPRIDAWLDAWLAKNQKGTTKDVAEGKQWARDICGQYDPDGLDLCVFDSRDHKTRVRRSDAVEYWCDMCLDIMEYHFGSGNDPLTICDLITQYNTKNSEDNRNCKTLFSSTEQWYV